MVLTYKKVPMFGYLDRPITKPEGKGWDNLGKRDILGVVLHRMLGTLWGTDTYFRLPHVNSLTDYGVGVKSSDGGQTGVIIRWNDPEGYRSGWASGPVSAPYGDGLLFVRKYGINAVNKRLVSLEISGMQLTPIDEFALNEIVHFIAWHADQKGISWEDFPYYKVTGMSFLFYHDEFTFGTGKRCPFEEVKNLINEIIRRVKAMLKKYQTGGTTVPAPTPTPTPAPAPSTGLKIGDWVVFDGEYNVRRAWNTDEFYDGEKNVVRVTTAGEKAKIIAGPNVNDGYTWWDVEIPGFGTGHVIADGMTKTEAPAPPPPPVKMWKDPAPVTEIALLDPNTEGELILPDGTVLEPVFDLVEAKAQGQMRRFAEGTDVIGPDYKPGEQYIAMYRFLHKGRRFLYLSNHARVYAENFDRVSDVVEL